MKRACLLAALFLAGCGTLQPAPPQEIVGYLAGWKPPPPIAAARLTVINYAFLDVAADGTLLLIDLPRDRAQFERLAKLREAHPHLKLVAAVGGWTRSSRFSDMAA